MKKKYVIGTIVAGAILVFFWSRFTFGFEEPLTPVARLAIILYIAFVIEAFAFSLTISKNKQLQKFIDDVDIDGLRKTEEKYHKLVQENDTLTNELITTRKNVILSGHKELLPENAKSENKSKSKEKGANKEKSESNPKKKTTSAKPKSNASIVRENKEKLAYKLKCAGKSRQEIADAIGLSVGSVSRYVSRGKQLSESEK